MPLHFGNSGMEFGGGCVQGSEEKVVSMDELRMQRKEKGDEVKFVAPSETLRDKEPAQKEAAGGRKSPAWCSWSTKEGVQKSG